MARRVPGPGPTLFRKSSSSGCGKKDSLVRSAGSGGSLKKDALLRSGGSGGSSAKLLSMQRKSSSRSLKGKTDRKPSGGGGGLAGGRGGGGNAQPDLAEAIQQQAQQAVQAMRSRGRNSVGHADSGTSVGGLPPAGAPRQTQAREAAHGQAREVNSPGNVGAGEASPGAGGAKEGSGDSLWEKAAANSSKKLPDGDALRASVPCDKCGTATPWKLKMPCGRRVPLCPPCTSAFLAVYQDHVTKSKAKQAQQHPRRQTVDLAPPEDHRPGSLGNYINAPVAAQSGFNSQRGARGPMQAQASLRSRQLSSKVMTRITSTGDAYGGSRSRLSLPVV